MKLEKCEYRNNINKCFLYVKKKDFSVKPYSNIKFRLIIDYCFGTDDKDAKAYIKNNFIKIMKKFIETVGVDLINQIIDKFISHATEIEKQEIFIIFTSSKIKLSNNNKN